MEFRPALQVKLIYVSTTFLKDSTSLHKALSQCREAGIKSVEIGSNHCYEKNYDYCTDFPFQYLVHNYFPIPRESFTLNIASLDNEIRKKSIAHIKTAIDFSAEIRAKLYTFHPGFLTDPLDSNNSHQNYDFQWDDDQLKLKDCVRAKNLMYKALNEIIPYAQLKKVRIAIETEGSLNNKNHLLMQRPEEYEELVEKYSVNDISINLNIGHLNLASKAFDFNRFEFVNIIQDYIVGMELSHNDGKEDQHLPLKDEGWYWELINDVRFKYVYKILEFRNTSISSIKKNIKFIEKFG